MVVDTGALAFFNKLSGELTIRLTEAPRPVSERLANLVAAPTARVDSLALTMTVFEGGCDLRALSAEESLLVVLRTSRIRMSNVRSREVVIEHEAPDGETFTVRDLVAAIEEAERRSRDASQWLGGVDVHHVFFEGLHLDADGTWITEWGS